MARRAAAWAAIRLVERQGRAEYFQAGFHQGLHVALEDRSIGRWDLEEGQRLGYRDPAARDHGSELGAAAALQIAAIEASRAAGVEFRQLDHRPSRRPAVELPPFRAPDSALAEAPTLRELFTWADHRLGSIRSGLGRHLEPWSLWRANDIGSFFDERWSAAGKAFDLWLGDRRHSAFFSSIRGDSSRARFKQIFADELDYQLARLYQNELLPSHERGFDSGWSYGAAVAAEWGYRKGYTDGFNQACADAAERAFSRAYAEAFRRSYHDTYLDWLESIRPEVLELTVEDAGGDGVLEPGEELRARYRLANFGGAPGQVRLRLDGVALEQPITAMLTAPARSEIAAETPIEATISQSYPAGETSTLRLEAGDHVYSIDLEVAYPLVLATEPTLIERDNLRGTARFEVAVMNQSRKAVPAAVRIEHDTGTSPQPRIELGSIEPGQAREAELVLESVPTLELLRGGTAARFLAMRQDVVHDTAQLRFPGVATDLENRDILVHMVRLARARGASAAEKAGLQQLLMRRLEHDWQAVVAASGNPYKKDYRSMGRQTALGDLVATYLEERPRMTHPEVFSGLAQRIEVLADDLPGVHPFLRKYMRRLARKLS